jgi:hypothetical protein
MATLLPARPRADHELGGPESRTARSLRMRIRVTGVVASCLIGWVLVTSLGVSHVNAQITTNVATDPAEAKMVYDDVRNFVRAMERLAAGGDSMAILQEEYFDRASPGLLHYMDDYDLTSEELLRAVRRWPRQYAKLRNLPERLVVQEDTFREAYARLKHLIPYTVYPPTYFVIGANLGASAASEQGQLISVERPYETERKVTVLVHELVHIQQALAQGIDQYQSLYGDGPERNLLALSIREGTADFITYLAVGRHAHEAAYDYIVGHEEEIWKRFQGEMHNREPGEWMWTDPSNPEEPRDLGYAMGVLIVRSYYRHAPDKELAVREILSVTDYEDFLERSRYAEQLR